MNFGDEGNPEYAEKNSRSTGTHVAQSHGSHVTSHGSTRMGPQANTQQKYRSVFDRCFDMLLRNDSVSTYQVKTKKVKNLS